jgi:hypothetical protein
VLPSYVCLKAIHSKNIINIHTYLETLLHYNLSIKKLYESLKVSYKKEVIKIQYTYFLCQLIYIYKLYYIGTHCKRTINMENVQ